MAGLLDFLAGSSDPSTADPTTGLVESQQRQLIAGILGQAGGALMAAGQPHFPGQNAQYLAQLGNIPGNVQTQMAQMGQLNRSNQTAIAEKRKNQQEVDLQAMISSPEVRAQLDKLSPEQQLVFKTAPLDQKAAILEKAIAANKTRVDANGNIIMGNGSVIDPFGRTIVGAGGQPVPGGQFGGQDPNNPQPTQTTAPARPPAVTPAAVAAQTAQTRGMGDPQVLQQIAQQFGPSGPEVAAKVKAWGDYKIPFPMPARNQAMMNPNSPSSQMLNAILAYNPNFNANGFSQGNKLWNEFYGSGKVAGNITALDTAYGHIGLLGDLTAGLNSNDPQIVNAALAKVNTALGDAKFTSADMAAGAVSHELAKVFRDTGMSNEDAAEWSKRFDVHKLSAEQMPAAINSALALMESRKLALETRYARANNGVGPNREWFTPEHVAKANALRQAYAAQNPGAPGTVGAVPGQQATPGYLDRVWSAVTGGGQQTPPAQGAAPTAQGSTAAPAPGQPAAPQAQPAPAQATAAPTPTDIAYVRAHPEKRAQFEKHFNVPPGFLDYWLNK